MNRVMLILFLSAATAIAQSSDAPPVVKITPLGSHAGEFCSSDRAMIFEDPAGVRILYDPGRTVDGGADARLGDIHVVLLSHAHTDHVGDVKINPASPGTCAAPGTVPAGPNSNIAVIIAAKNAAFFGGGELSTYIGRKVQDVRSGTATPACAGVGLTNELVVPLTAPCSASLRPGGSRSVRLSGASAAVKIAAVPAFHSDGIPAALTDDPGVAPGTAAYGGSETGFIIMFTNGLTVYLTGDTGMFGDMKTIIHKYYHANLMVANISDTVTLGPDEAAFAATKLVKPQTVIPSHINEAATTNGSPTGDRMTRFIEQMNGSNINIVLPLSGVTREFDGGGNCLNCS